MQICKNYTSMKFMTLRVRFGGVKSPKTHGNTPRKTINPKKNMRPFLKLSSGHVRALRNSSSIVQAWSPQSINCVKSQGWHHFKQTPLNDSKLKSLNTQRVKPASPLSRSMNLAWARILGLDVGFQGERVKMIPHPGHPNIRQACWCTGTSKLDKCSQLLSMFILNQKMNWLSCRCCIVSGKIRFETVDVMSFYWFPTKLLQHNHALTAAYLFGKRYLYTYIYSNKCMQMLNLKGWKGVTKHTSRLIPSWKRCFQCVETWLQSRRNEKPKSNTQEIPTWPWSAVPLNIALEICKTEMRLNKLGGNDLCQWSNIPKRISHCQTAVDIVSSLEVLLCFRSTLVALVLIWWIPNTVLKKQTRM